MTLLFVVLLTHFSVDMKTVSLIDTTAKLQENFQVFECGHTKENSKLVWLIE
jgi:hypothetical protein